MEKTRSKAVTDCDNKTMLSYCLKCRKNTESKNPEVLNTKSGKTMLLSSYEVCANKKNPNSSKRKKPLGCWKN